MKYFFLIAGLLIFSFKKSEAQLFSGSLHCTLAGRSWNGTIQTAMYKKQEDYIFLAFENDSSRLEVTLKTVKKELSNHIPYKDMIRGDYKNGVDPNLVFFSRYFPNKKKTTYNNAFTMLEADFFVDALDLTAGTIKIAFEQTMGKATRRFNPLHPDERALEKMEINEAESSEIKFISF
jgi:hypothetical protein